ncbi:MAG: YncE family protein [Acidobacteria bacterium]|nr:YncE family protein [Acidobacteriota bacterium]MCW5970735.1 YncE family protein [Blastocatellales bacterium]
MSVPWVGTGKSAAGESEKGYKIYVVSEASDTISVIDFGPGGAQLEREFRTGIMEPDVDGPHGIAFSPDRKNYFVSLGHGRPFGSVWKYSADGDRVLKRVTLGPFPATMDVSRDGNFLYVVNFNLHGDMVPSSVSVVVADEMLEIRRIPTCTMPHGSRFNPQGTRHYSACMMDDLLVEIDATTLAVSRHFLLTKGKEKGMQGSPEAMLNARSSGPADHSGHGLEAPKPGDAGCSPTWAQPSSDGSTIFVACNKSSEIVEIDAGTWKVLRRIEAGPGVYNLAVTKDGKLIATNKRGPSVSIYDVKTGRELARLATLRKVVHGAAVSPDNRYAFISVEGVGSEPGTVEIIDLKTLKTAARVDVAPQAAGIEVR